MEFKSFSYWQLGLQMSYDLALNKSRKGILFPVTLRYLQLPERKFEFLNYPNDSLEILAGGELQLSLGAAIGF